MGWSIFLAINAAVNAVIYLATDGFKTIGVWFAVVVLAIIGVARLWISEAKHWEAAGGHFSWEEVEPKLRSFQSRPANADMWDWGHRESGHSDKWQLSRAGKCPQCGTPPEQLIWLWSPQRLLWRQRSGGWIVVCDQCNVQVSFVFASR